MRYLLGVLGKDAHDKERRAVPADTCQEGLQGEGRQQAEADEPFGWKASVGTWLITARKFRPPCTGGSGAAALPECLAQATLPLPPDGKDAAMPEYSADAALPPLPWPCPYSAKPSVGTWFHLRFKYQAPVKAVRFDDFADFEGFGAAAAAAAAAAAGTAAAMPAAPSTRTLGTPAAALAESQQATPTLQSPSFPSALRLAPPPAPSAAVSVSTASAIAGVVVVDSLGEEVRAAAVRQKASDTEDTGAPLSDDEEALLGDRPGREAPRLRPAAASVSTPASSRSAAAARDADSDDDSPGALRGALARSLPGAAGLAETPEMVGASAPPDHGLDGPGSGPMRGMRRFTVRVPRGYPGIQYRKSKDLHDRTEGLVLVANEGHIVEGYVEDDGEWLRIRGDYFLPIHVGGKRVLHQLSDDLSTAEAQGFQQDLSPEVRPTRENLAQQPPGGWFWSWCSGCRGISQDTDLVVHTGNGGPADARGNDYPRGAGHE